MKMGGVGGGGGALKKICTRKKANVLNFYFNRQHNFCGSNKELQLHAFPIIILFVHVKYHSFQRKSCYVCILYGLRLCDNNYNNNR